MARMEIAKVCFDMLYFTLRIVRRSALLFLTAVIE